MEVGERPAICDEQVISIKDLLEMTRSSGHPQDREDVVALEKLR